MRKQLGAWSPRAAPSELRSQAVQQVVGLLPYTQSLRDMSIIKTHASRGKEESVIFMESGIYMRNEVPQLVQRQLPSVVENLKTTFQLQMCT